VHPLRQIAFTQFKFKRNMTAPRLDQSNPALEMSSPGSSAPRRWSLLLLPLYASVAAVVMLLAPRDGKLQAQAQLLTTNTNAVTSRRPILASGWVEPVRQVKISPEVSGEIVELPVKEGQLVAKGELLLRIKPDYYVANRDQAEGNYKSAQANIDIAKARLQEANAELKRDQDLYNGQLISSAMFESAKAQCEIAKAQLGNADGQLETARGLLARAQDDLQKTTIHSPIAGTVARLNSQVGERVVGTATMAGTEIMTLADLNRMEARVEVSETDIRSIKCGGKVRLELTAFPGRLFDGTVVEMATSCDRFATHTGTSASDSARFAVRILLNEWEELRPGMSVKAEIPVSTDGLAGKSATEEATGVKL
jgi:HlyD family secretion protein